MELTIQITQSEVFLEVSKQTDYIGTKMTGDEDARSRIATTDHDNTLLQSYFAEAADNLVARCGFLVSNTPDPYSEVFELQLSMPSNWDATKEKSVTSTMKKYVEKYIIQAWDKVTNKKENEAHNKDALSLLEQINYLIHATRKPTRPTI